MLKTINTWSVLNIIREKEPISRSDIVKQSSLAFPTVMRIVNELIELGLVVEEGKGEPEVGRKPTLLCMKKDAFYVIGIAVLPNTEVYISDLAENIIAEYREEPGHPSGVDASLQLQRIIEIVGQLLKKTQIDRAHIAGIGFATPGTDFKSSGEISDYRFYGWDKKIDAAKILQDSLNIPVFAENLSRTMAYSEIFHGWGRKYKDFVFVQVGYGVSGSIVQNAKILKGHDNVAGEYGHICIDYKNGRKCYCGNTGCLETYVSSHGILRTVRERLTDDKNSLLNELMEEKALLDFNMVEFAAKQNDSLVINVLCEAATMIGQFLVNIVNIYNPWVIVLGGSVINAYPGMLREIEAVLQEKVFSNKARKTKVLISMVPKEKERLGTTTRVIMSILNQKLLDQHS